MGKVLWARGNPLLKKHPLVFSEMPLLPSGQKEQGFTSFHHGSFPIKVGSLGFSYTIYNKKSRKI
jgi:hypothetical protein